MVATVTLLLSTVIGNTVMLVYVQCRPCLIFLPRYSSCFAILPPAPPARFRCFSLFFLFALSILIHAIIYPLPPFLCRANPRVSNLTRPPRLRQSAVGPELVRRRQFPV